MLAYSISPIVFKHSTFVQRHLLFMNMFNTHYAFNLSQPDEAGLRCVRTLLIDNKGDKLGAWHVLPSSKLSSCLTDEQSNRTSIDESSAFNDRRPIVLYVHGNGGNRAGRHRVALYKRFAYEADYHIITFDYRGYGDSTYRTPSAKGLTQDALAMYDWLLKQKNVDKSRIVVYGHSLGTAVAARCVSEIPTANQPPTLILEAPFDTLANAIANHPFAAPFKLIPNFNYFFVDPIEQSTEFNFDTAKALKFIKKTKLLILHAEDDRIIPFKLGQNLYKKASKLLGDANVKFVGLDASHGLGHKYICKHDQTIDLIRKFIDTNV